MKLFLLLLSMLSLTACNNQQLTSNYTFRYSTVFYDIDEVKSYEVVVEDNKPVQVANTVTGVMLPSVEEASDLKTIMNVVSGKENNYRIKYYKNGFPKEIKDPENNNTTIDGAPFLDVYLYDYQNVGRNFSIAPNIQERYFNANYAKWSSLNLLDYRFKYGDSKIEHEHLIKVVDNKIVGLVDEWTLTPLTPTKTDEFLTIDEIFTKLRGELSSKKCQMEINYNREYGYPSRIHYNCQESDTRRIYLYNLEIPDTH